MKIAIRFFYLCDMFLAIVIIITLLWGAAEWVILCHSALRWSKKRRFYYLLTSGLCTLPFWVSLGIGRIWEIHTTFWSNLGAVIMVLFLLNAGIKIVLAMGVLGRLWSGKKWPFTASVIFATIFGVSILYGSLIEIKSLRINHRTIYFDNLPEAAEGLTIAQLGDIHFSLRSSSPRMARKIASAIAQIEPDLVVDCGDLINSRYDELSEEIVAIMSTIQAPLGVYTVEGNHDKGDYITDTLALPREEHRRLYAERLASMGWQDLTERSVAVAIGNGSDSLYISGLPYPTSLAKGTHGESITEDYSANFAHLPADAFNMVLAHNPIAWSNILEAVSAELTLSGHVHSMQVKIPIGERGWSPAAWIYPKWSGHYEDDGRHLHITDGIGSAVPVRLGVPPEIVVIELRTRQASH